MLDLGLDDTRVTGFGAGSLHWIKERTAKVMTYDHYFEVTI